MPTTRIDRMGIELEGGWLSPWATEIHPQSGRTLPPNTMRRRVNYDGEHYRAGTPRHLINVTRGEFHGDGSVGGLGAGYYSGEMVSPPVKADELCNWVHAYHPDKQNDTCGTHVHVSLEQDGDYDRLAKPQFYYWFLSQAVHWFESQPNVHADAREQFYKRLRGENSYCCPNYQDCGRHRSYEQQGCNHHCRDHGDNACYDYSACAHDCHDSLETAWRAFRRSHGRNGAYCMQVACMHNCDDSECEDNCDHECIDYPGECFFRGNCRHYHDTLCHSRACPHECTVSCGGVTPDGDIERGCHVPRVQRRLTSKDSPRYAHINYCEQIHETIEFRLFPAFRDAALTASCVKFVHDAIENYLEFEAPPLAPPAPFIVSIATAINDTSAIAPELAHAV